MTVSSSHSYHFPIRSRHRGRNKKWLYIQETGPRAELLAKLKHRFQYEDKYSNLIVNKITGSTRRTRSSQEAGDKSAMVKALASALRHRLVVNVDMADYGGKWHKLKLPNPKFGHISSPCTIVDRHGRILVWYFPGLLPELYQNKLIEATNLLNPIFSRLGMVNGTETFSPGWFALGHGKCPTAEIKTSCSIRNNMNRGVEDWLHEIQEPSKFLDQLLSITHPTLYDASSRVLAQLRVNTLTEVYARLWPSVFSGMSPITNRVTPDHKDKFGHIPWYDQVVTVGTYRSATLSLPELGTTLQYNPGTVVHFCGNLLTHSVSKWDEGNRICYASFFRKDVFEGVDLPGWAKDSYYGLNIE